MGRRYIDFSDGRTRVSVVRESGIRASMSRCHVHDSYELYFLTGGDRYLFVGGRFFHVRAGDLFVIPPGLEHRTLEAEVGEYSKLICMLPPRLLPLGASEISDVRITRPTGELLSGLLFSAGIASDGTDVEGYAAVLRLLAAAVSQPEHREEVSSPAFGRMSDIIAYLDAHYTERISLTELAGRLFISEYYLCRLFKEYTGRTVLSYLTELRVGRAKQLLLGTDMKIGRVARASGFGSVSAFGKAFAAAVGVSPREYRRREADVE